MAERSTISRQRPSYRDRPIQPRQKSRVCSNRRINSSGGTTFDGPSGAVSEHHAAGITLVQRGEGVYAVVGSLHVFVAYQPAIAAGGTHVHGHGAATERRSVAGDLDVRQVATVVESRLALEPEAHLSAHDADHPDQAVPVRGLLAGDRHEVDHLADAVGAEEARDEDRRPRQVQLLGHVVDAVRRDPEVTALAAGPAARRRCSASRTAVRRTSRSCRRSRPAQRSAGLRSGRGPRLLDKSSSMPPV